ncbi:outer membrane lipoprotein carrier protein LolA [Paenibacillus nanensis]|uniref:Outer membrane lipoprotein carrier protein LolA n=1 Tax=Paenibacillus nanensis TaxID=393251 RepID=A0A3A1UWR6_9BACL|nr:outer membrane lipoprotein carrier protein LolA [Paenibacillus nanensis]RIX50773.1 outer membrane lipoprotein carrier protein LolA [Paenibacillus nanensis]
MRRMTWTAAIILCFALVLSACGTAKDAESVVKELDKVVNSMESYQGSGTMTLHTGQQPLEYQVEVTYQKPAYYRIKLTNEEKDITQIVLRNDEGVFVLTPKLNKVFRFQSDWPQNQGQVYLYQTLIQSILVDGSRSFAAEEDAYVFDVMANYNNGSLARQKIWLDKDDLSPVQVEVSDTNATVMVDVKFDSFKFDEKFDKSVFETQANMSATPPASSGTADEPTIATPEESDDAAAPGDDAANGDHEAGQDEEEVSNPDEDAAAEVDGEEALDFVVMGPSYMPEGVTEKDSSDIVYGGNPGQITRYEGTYSYTLIQTMPKDMASTYVPGRMVSLGHTMGELTEAGDDTLRTLTWTYEGHLFRLASADLPETEMVKVAQSVQGEMEK